MSYNPGHTDAGNRPRRSATSHPACPHRLPCDALLADPLAALADPARRPTHLCYGTLAVAPFPGDEAALLVLTFPLADAVVTFYGLADPADPVWGGCGPCRFVVAGDRPDAAPIRQAIALARRWWSRFAGTPILGRPDGRTVSADLHRAATTLLAAGEPPTQERVAELLDRDVSTVKRAARDHHGGWRTFLDALA